MTAMEIAKSKKESGWGKFRLSATTEECGLCLLAIVTKVSDLEQDSAFIIGKDRETMERSDKAFTCLKQL
jgi:hypothetical protein